MKHLGDILAVSGYTIPPVDVATCGSPCQDLSVAGKQTGMKHEAFGDIETTRSGLFMESIRIMKEMRCNTFGQYPKYFVWENVPGAFSSNNGEDFRVVLEELCKICDENAAIPRPEKGKWHNCGSILGDGYSLAWRTMDAQFWGVPQRRRRIALVVDFRGHTAPETLFKPESVQGYFRARPEKGQGDTTDTQSGVGAASGCVGFDGYNQAVTGDVAHSLRACKSDSDHCPIVFENHGHDLRFTGPLDTAPACNRQAGTGGNNTPLCVSFDSLASNSMKSSNPFSGCHITELSKALDTSNPCPSKNQGGVAIVQPCYCIAENTIARQPKNGGNGLGINEDVCHTLNATGVHAVSEAAVDMWNLSINTETNGCVQASAFKNNNSNNTLLQHQQVRKLTPLEYEALQGFPGGWTDIGEWVDSKGKTKQSSDSARYKALGNSIALPQWCYVLGNIAERLPFSATLGSLFDGIGGFPLVWSDLHWGNKAQCLWASEIEDFCIAVTKKHFGED